MDSSFEWEIIPVLINTTKIWESYIILEAMLFKGINTFVPVI